MGEGPLDHFAPRTPLPQPLFSRRPETGQRSHIVARSLCEIFSGDLKSIQTHSAASHHSFYKLPSARFLRTKCHGFSAFPLLSFSLFAFFRDDRVSPFIITTPTRHAVLQFKKDEKMNLMETSNRQRQVHHECFLHGLWQRKQGVLS